MSSLVSEVHAGAAEPRHLRAGEAVPARRGHPRTGTFAALAIPLYRRLWISGGVMFVAVMGQNIARGWLAKDLTGSNAGLGGVMLGFGLPMMVAVPWGGVAADRFPKRTVLMASVVILMLTSSWIGLAVTFDFMRYWMLVVAAGLQAVAFALYMPARMAFITELVDRSMLANAITLSQMGAEGARVVGPALAGLLIASASFGTEAVFFVSTGLSLVGLLTLVGMPPGRAPTGRPPGSPYAELRDGVRYVRAFPVVRLLVLTSLGVVIAGFPYMAFLPALADDVFDVGSDGYGVMSTVNAAGAVATGLLVARRADRDPWRLLTLCGLLFAGSVFLLALAPSFPLALVALFAIGGMSLGFQTSNQALLFSLAKFDFHGRIQGLVMLGFSGFGIAALPLGVVADVVGLRPTLAAMGGFGVLVMLVFMVRGRALRPDGPLVILPELAPDAALAGVPLSPVGAAATPAGSGRRGWSRTAPPPPR